MMRCERCGGTDHYAPGCSKPLSEAEKDSPPIGAGAGEKVSRVPCNSCQGPCREFVVPSDVWNTVVRGDGPEGYCEYLCESCYRDRVAIYVRKARRTIDGMKAEIRSDGDLANCGAQTQDEWVAGKCDTCRHRSRTRDDRLVDVGTTVFLPNGSPCKVKEHGLVEAAVPDLSGSGYRTVAVAECWSVKPSPSSPSKSPECSICHDPYREPLRWFADSSGVQKLWCDRCGEYGVPISSPKSPASSTGEITDALARDIQNVVARVVYGYGDWKPKELLIGTIMHEIPGMIYTAVEKLQSKLDKAGRNAKPETIVSTSPHPA